jgi:ABC-type sulfate/molybdate transport systems ATPase subunit
MSIAFHRVTCPPLRDFEAAAPDGVVIGLVGENASGKGLLLRVAARLDQPESGSVELSGPCRFLMLGDALNLAPIPVLLIDQTFSHHDAVVRERAAIGIDRLRRAGTTVLLASHEDGLIRRLADEVWWLHDGLLAGRGDPEEILGAYSQHIAERVRGSADSAAPLTPRMRRGDGRAEIVAIETIGEDGRPTMIWRSGELAIVRVRVRFRHAVADPVVGIMIRTRVGLNVYGTNTELERLPLGPRAAGDTLEISFAFRCELCPQEYTLTAASHDPDGVWHDWLEDAVAFSVSDTRYTAGVANLRATVSVQR